MVIAENTTCLDVHFHKGNLGAFSDAPNSSVEFVGIHPWFVENFEDVSNVEKMVQQNTALGVGEIGLDRLHSPTISPKMREIFQALLQVAANYHRPCVLHGAKCWGEVVKMCLPFSKQIPSFLFHGFSRSVGLIGDIGKLNGFVSIGPAILNDHAVNYRNMVKNLPAQLLLIETDYDENQEGHSSIERQKLWQQIFERVAFERSISHDDLFELLSANEKQFLGGLLTTNH